MTYENLRQDQISSLNNQQVLEGFIRQKRNLMASLEVIWPYNSSSFYEQKSTDNTLKQGGNYGITVHAWADVMRRVYL